MGALESPMLWPALLRLLLPHQLRRHAKPQHFRRRRTGHRTSLSLPRRRSLPASPLHASPPSPPPLPPPCTLRTTPPRHGPPPPPFAGTPPPPPAAPQFVERLPPGRRGVPVIPRGVPCHCVDDLAGVPPELLPPKKRVVRYHPYAAAAAIQEMSASHVGGRGFLLGASAEVDVAAEEEEDDDRNEDGLRAELLRLRIARPAVVLTKQLTPSDRSRDKARLVLPDRLVSASPLLRMLTAAERALVLGGGRGGGGLRVPALDRLGRAYRMSLRRDPHPAGARTYRLTGQWSHFVSRHAARAGDAVELRAFRPPAWQARLHMHGEGGLGVALLLHRRRRRRRREEEEEEAAGKEDDGGGRQREGCQYWCSRERDAADGLLLIAAGA